MKPQNIPADIYRMFMRNEVAKGVDVEHIAETFAQECKTALLEALGPPQKRAGRLRLSAVGKSDRQVYNDYHGVKGEQLSGSTYIKFLYGHIVEAMVLALTEAAGHKVEEKQKVCTVEGVEGHQDCRIDGVLTDVKSASSFSFLKFKNRQMPFNDPFGYVAQMKAYASEEGDTQYGWLVLDKQHGNIEYVLYDEDKFTEKEKEVFDYDIQGRVRYLKDMVKSDTIPAQCHDTVPDGKSGNMKLGTGCHYCDYKHSCFPNIRTFIYASGPKYLTEVKKLPKTTEVLESF